MKFLEVIGKHVQSSGLLEAWIEGSLLGPNTAQQAMSGKSYAKGMRAHKVTVQALWRILLPKLLKFIRERDHDCAQQIEDKTSKGDSPGLISLFADEDVSERVGALIACNPNWKFWWT